MRVCLFEDQGVGGLEPIALSRPAFGLLCGCTTLADKQLFHFGATSVAALVRPHLADSLAERGGYAVNDARWLAQGPAALVNARWLPPNTPPPAFTKATVALVEDEVAYAVLTPELMAGCGPQTINACLERWRGMLPTIEAGGAMVRHLWDLVGFNAETIRRDVSMGDPAPPPQGDAPALVGPRDRLHIAPGAQIDPYVVADTTDGPVVIDEGAKVTAFSRLEGPCFIGPRCQVLGAKVRAGTTLGPECRVGGEVECSIIQGFSNKYHDGFLGHAYVGSWVNIGAGTSNSDLRNDYGEVRVVVDGQLVRTGQSKVGCFLGDHTKAALGCLLNTGTSAGAFAQLLPSGGLLPRYVPSFTSVFQGALVEQDDLDGLLATARMVMQRRNKPLTPALDALYRGLFAQTARERSRALREAERRRLRLSA